MSNKNKCELNIDGIKETFEINQICPNTNGSVLYTCDGNVIMANVVCDTRTQVQGDFLPLTVQYMHKTYSIGQIPGGYIKREAKPSEFEIITSRLIDRCLRVLFDDNFNYNVLMTIVVLSHKKYSPLQSMALKAANAALFCSDLGINRFLHASRIGMLGDKIYKYEEIDNSSLDMFVVACDEEIITIDLEAKDDNYISHDKFINVLSDTKKDINKKSAKYKNILSKFKANEAKEIKGRLTSYLSAYDKKNIGKIAKKNKNKILKALHHTNTLDIEKALFEITSTISKKLSKHNISIEKIISYVNSYKKKLVKQQILNTQIRADGRALNEVRPIKIRTNLLPNAHGSCLFSRGGTKALVVSTVGGIKDAQLHESLSGNREEENFMFHYNFPGYSVGECSPHFGVGRRELGHGTLAKKALIGTIKAQISNASVRLVSEILASNGSSSMASVCGGSLALRDSNFENTLVAGVAMGLVRDKKTGKDFVLSDISAIEDACGDMDLKIAGSANGISALHLDIKMNSIGIASLVKALKQAKIAKEHILKIMQKTCKSINSKTNIASTETFFLDAKTFPMVIGKSGATIKEITNTFNVDISLKKESSQAIITSMQKDNIKKAKERILEIASSYQKEVDYASLYAVNDIFSGKITQITNFGMFVSMPQGGEGLVHISKISSNRIEHIDNYFEVDESVEVIILGIDGRKIQLQLATLL